MSQGNPVLIVFGLALIVAGGLVTFYPQLSSALPYTNDLNDKPTQDAIGPNKSIIKVESEPSGVNPFIYSNKQYTAPFSITVDAGSHTIVAPSSWKSSDGTAYNFAKWDIGQIGIQRVVVIGPNSTTSIKAFYEKAYSKAWLKIETIRGLDAYSEVLPQYSMEGYDLRATIYIDGVNKGPSPLVVNLDLGKYVVSFGSLTDYRAPDKIEVALTKVGESRTVRGVYLDIAEKPRVLTVRAEAMPLSFESYPLSDVQIWLSDGQLGFTDSSGTAIFHVKDGVTIKVSCLFDSETVTMTSDKTVILTYSVPQSTTSLPQSILGETGGTAIGIVVIALGVVIALSGVFSGKSSNRMLNMKGGRR